ncbi:MAG: Type 1 glutamine amidotransferase-like domain-containing protein [Proteobacteria bacterium]|nr:Type 1 glutamine amidotransferase-like domain-containing protein [Pseudomonadota bacterium]
MKLVLYSGYDDDNRLIDQEIVPLIGKSSPRVTFIPSAHYVPEFEYEYLSEAYAEYGIRNISIFNADQPFSSSQLEKALNTDLIYLGGGNTFYFLYWIKRQGLDTRLRQFVARGGVLAGLSAGAIIMTPSIATASYPKFDRDHNDVKIEDLTALGFVSFEFFPHYEAVEEYAKELRKQSKKISWPIYGVDDGGGIIVNHHSLRFFGRVWGYVGGKEFKVHPFD